MSADFTDKTLIFTDGACSGNPGVGGYGTVIAMPTGTIHELGGRRSSTTNNRMEMLAVIEGLRYVLLNASDLASEVWVLTDSTYTIRGITQWIFGWKRKGWKTAAGKEVGNQDLWQELDGLVRDCEKRFEISWKYVRGHSGTPGNERCDEIAVAFTKRQYIDLYSGPLLQYEFAIHDLPEDMSLPPMRDKVEKKKAHSYLSYVNGSLKRHKSWPLCEAEVKGRPGAKFKKSTSAENEIEIVKGWGLDPKLLK